MTAAASRTAPANRRLRLRGDEVANDGCAYVWEKDLPGVQAGDRVILEAGRRVVDGEVLKIVAQVARVQIFDNTWRTETPGGA